MPITATALSSSSFADSDWLEQVHQQLGGATVPFLDEQTAMDTAGVSPDDLRQPPASPVSWQPGAYIRTDDYRKSNAFARKEVAQGAEALLFRLYRQPDTEAIETLLRGIDIERTSLHCSLSYSGQDPAELFRDLVRFMRRGNYDLRRVAGSVDFDPLLDWSEPPYPPLIRLLDFVSRWMPDFQVLQVNAAGFNNGIEGADVELALALAKGVQYLRELESQGYPAGLAHRHLQFALTIGTSFHGDIAKIRTLRTLWKRILTQAEITSSSPGRIAVHSDLVTVAEDYAVNYQQLFLQALSATHGQADLLFLSPAPTLRPGDTSDKSNLIRTVQHRLRQEVLPLAPSSRQALALLTRQLEEATWSRYQAIEAQGGFMEATGFYN